MWTETLMNLLEPVEVRETAVKGFKFTASSISSLPPLIIPPPPFPPPSFPRNFLKRVTVSGVRRTDGVA